MPMEGACEERLDACATCQRGPAWAYQWRVECVTLLLARPLRPSTEGTQETERRLAEAQSMIARCGTSLVVLKSVMDCCDMLEAPV